MQETHVGSWLYAVIVITLICDFAVLMLAGWVLLRLDLKLKQDHADREVFTHLLRSTLVPVSGVPMSPLPIESPTAENIAEKVVDRIADKMAGNGGTHAS